MRSVPETEVADVQGCEEREEMNKRLMYDDEFEAWTRFACAALTAAVADPRLATDTNVIEAAAHYADRMMTQWQTRRPYPESPYAAEVTKGDPTQ